MRSIFDLFAIVKQIVDAGGNSAPSPCSACGFENEPNAKFCGGCGKPVGETAAPAPTAPSLPLARIPPNVATLP